MPWTPSRLPPLLLWEKEITFFCASIQSEERKRGFSNQNTWFVLPAGNLYRGHSGALLEEGPSFLKGKPSFNLSPQNHQWDGTGEQLWLPQHPTQHSTTVAWRSWCLGLFIMAFLACQGHKQHKEDSKACPKGWTCTCVPSLCHISWHWRRDLLQGRRN